VEQIWGYRQLVAEAEYLRQTQFDCDNFEHERKLYDLWDCLMPDEKLESKNFNFKRLGCPSLNCGNKIMLVII